MQVGGHGPVYVPMARAIAGGLAFSAVTTLLIHQAVYLFFDDVRSWGRPVTRAPQDNLTPGLANRMGTSLDASQKTIHTRGLAQMDLPSLPAPGAEKAMETIWR